MSNNTASSSMLALVEDLWCWCYKYPAQAFLHIDIITRHYTKQHKRQQRCMAAMGMREEIALYNMHNSDDTRISFWEGHLGYAGILQEAMGRGEYWRLVDGQGRPPGLMGMWPSRAVTFIENHDTGAACDPWTLYATHTCAKTTYYRQQLDCGVCMQQPLASQTQQITDWTLCFTVLDEMTI